MSSDRQILADAWQVAIDHLDDLAQPQEVEIMRRDALLARLVQRVGGVCDQLERLNENLEAATKAIEAVRIEIAGP